MARIKHDFMIVRNTGEEPILPCPFCGMSHLDDLLVIRDNNHVSWHRVLCDHCLAMGSPGDYVAGAISQWNRASRVRAIHGDTES